MKNGSSERDLDAKRLHIGENKKGAKYIYTERAAHETRGRRDRERESTGLEGLLPPWRAVLRRKSRSSSTSKGCL